MAEYFISFCPFGTPRIGSTRLLDHSPHPPKIESLAVHPRPQGSRKLTGEKHLWRLRIGDYRVIYSILDKEDERHLKLDRRESKNSTYKAGAIDAIRKWPRLRMCNSQLVG